MKNIKIKHGCTEFYEEYPEYEKINYNGEQNFKYLNDWKVKEDIIDKDFIEQIKKMKEFLDQL